MRGSTFRVLQTLVSIGIGFAMMPFLIGELGKELYGLWVVVGSVVGTYYLLDMGFSQAVTRFVTKYIHQERYEDANKIINTALVIYSVLGAFVLLVSVGFAFLGAESLLEDKSQVSLVQILLIVGGLQLALEFPAKAFPGVIGSYMRFDWIAKVRTAKTIVDALLIYIFISNGYGLITMAVIGFVTGCISTAIYVAIVNKLFSQLKYGRRYVDLMTLKGIYSFSKWVFLLDLSVMLRGKIDIWLIAFFQGNSILTVYYVAVRLVDYAISLLSQATNMTTPIFTEYYAKEQWPELRRSLRDFIKLDFYFALLAMSGFYLLGATFINLWMGDAFPVEQSWSCLVVLVVGRMASYISLPLQCLLFTFNRHRDNAILAVLETAVVLCLGLLLIPEYGILGAAFSVAIPTFIGRLVILPVISNRVFQFLDSKFLFQLLASLCAIGAITYGYKFSGLLVGRGLVDLLLGATIVVITSVTTLVFLITRENVTILRRWVRDRK